MSIVFAKQVREKAASDDTPISVDFSATLDSGDTLTGTPTITEVTTSDLTLANKTVNASAVVVNGVSRAAGQVIQFSCTGGDGGELYKIKMSCDTTNGRTIVRGVKLRVLLDPA